jgi:hypothetical protein
MHHKIGAHFELAEVIETTPNQNADITVVPLSPSKMRTTLNILYACVSAIVASSWATARPNAPASHRQTFLITFYLIVFPEVVLTWALREYKDARCLSKSALFCFWD